MKKIILILALIVEANLLSAQYLLKTPDGRSVKLNTDGTWNFESTDSVQASAKTNQATYTSKKKQFSITFNTNNWDCDSNANLWNAEFVSANGVIKAYFNETTAYYPKNKIEATVTENLKTQGKVKKYAQQTKIINGLEVQYFKFVLEFSGFLYDYSGFIYSDKNGSIQLMFAGQSEIFNLNAESINELMNGVRKINN